MSRWFVIVVANFCLGIYIRVYCKLVYKFHILFFADTVNLYPLILRLSE